MVSRQTNGVSAPHCRPSRPHSRTGKFGPQSDFARAPVPTKKRTVRPFAVVVARAAAMGFVDCAVIGLLSRLASTLAPVRCESISLLLGATWQ
jgi:hypothetical protein